MAPFIDGVILVYRVGKIGRGVLKRAKMSLDNINAKVYGVILNNVKPETGPDYFKYHTQYYYGQPDNAGEGPKRKKMHSSSAEKTDNVIRVLVLLMLLGLLLGGIFWEELLIFLEPYLMAY